MDGADLSCRTNNMGLAVECEMQEATRFCSSGAREYIPGLMSWTLDYSGFFSAGDNDVDPNSFDSIGGDSLSTFLISPVNESTVGSLAYFGQANKSSYTPLGAVGEIAPFSITMQGDGRICNGTIIAQETIASTSGYTTVYELNGVEDGQPIQTILEITNMSGAGNVIIVLDVSCTSGFGSGVTEVTFDTLTDEGGSYKSATPTSTDKVYYRLDYATSGPNEFDLTVAVAENYGA